MLLADVFVLQSLSVAQLCEQFRHLLPQHPHHALPQHFHAQEPHLGKVRKGFPVAVLQEGEAQMGAAIRPQRHRIRGHFGSRVGIGQRDIAQRSPFLAVAAGIAAHQRDVVGRRIAPLHVECYVARERFVQVHLQIVRILYLVVPVAVPECVGVSIQQVFQVLALLIVGGIAAQVVGLEAHFPAPVPYCLVVKLLCFIIQTPVLLGQGLSPGIRKAECRAHQQGYQSHVCCISFPFHL